MTAQHQTQRAEIDTLKARVAVLEGRGPHVIVRGPVLTPRQQHIQNGGSNWSWDRHLRRAGRSPGR